MPWKKTWSRQELRPLYIQLNQLCKQLAYKYDINNGGCCFVALCIAKELSKRNIHYGLVLYHYKDLYCSTREIRDNIINRDVNSFPTGNYTTEHYAIKLNHIGVINDDDCECDYEHRTINNISPIDIQFIYDNGRWNSDYNTSYNKKVRTEIIKFFKHYEEEYFAEV